MHPPSRALLASVWFALLLACDDTAEICEAYAAAACDTDTACDGTDPCSFQCDGLEVEDTEALEACTAEVEAITIPDATAAPLENALACGERYSKQLDCLQLFEP